MRAVNGLEEKESEDRSITLACISVIIFSMVILLWEMGSFPLFPPALLTKILFPPTP